MRLYVIPLKPIDKDHCKAYDLESCLSGRGTAGSAKLADVDNWGCEQLVSCVRYGAIWPPVLTKSNIDVQVAIVTILVTAKQLTGAMCRRSDQVPVLSLV